MTKLSVEKVARMRELFRAGASYDELSRLMKVSRTCAVNAVHGLTWKDVAWPVPRRRGPSASRLGAQAVVDIREAYDEGRMTLGDIAARFGVSAATVSRIGRRRVRADVPERLGPRGPSVALPDRRNRGERSNLARLSRREAETIRRLAASLGTGAYEAIARAFDTSRSNVSMIATGRRWRHVA